MPKFVTALYDDAQQAQQATESLKENGFKGPDIQWIDEKRTAEGFFDRLFLDENGGSHSEDLSVMGISPDHVDHYRRRIEAGGALLILMCDKARTDEAVDIMGRFDVAEVMTPEARESEASKKKRGAVQSGRTEAEQSEKWFHVVDIEEEDPTRGARSHSVHVRARSDIKHQLSNEMPGARPSTPFEQFERECRLHYRENYAGSRHDFDDYKLAYRYGIALAENRGLNTGDWPSIKDHARRGWEDNLDRPWSEFSEAVRFGWRAMRRHKRRETRWR